MIPADWPIDSATERFRAAAREGVIEAPRCQACGLLVWYPRPQCPRCMSDDLVWQRLADTGTVYTFTVNRRPAPAQQGNTPSVIAYVTLDDGPRVLGLLCGVDPDRVQIEDRVRLAPSDGHDDGEVLRFTSVPAPD